MFSVRPDPITSALIRARPDAGDTCSTSSTTVRENEANAKAKSLAERVFSGLGATLGGTFAAGLTVAVFFALVKLAAHLGLRDDDPDRVLSQMLAIACVMLATASGIGGAYAGSLLGANLARQTKGAPLAEDTEPATH